MNPNGSRLDDVFAQLLARREAQGRLRRLTRPPTNAVDFSSNSYLSFANNSELRKRYISLLQSDDTNFSLGSGGSRLLDGNNALVEEIESKIAAFHRAPSGLLFNSGLDANTGLFGCVSQPGDVVIYDELIHASVHDGMKLGRAKKIPFAHNAVATGGDGSIKCLDVVLQELCSGTSGEAFVEGKKNVFIAVEGVYSMDGDTAPLNEIVACVRQRLPEGNGYIIVDEAHSTGVIGERGRGLVCHLGLEDQIWARVHTFGKAMGCSGAIVLGSPTTRSYLINYARSLIYTTAIGYPSLAAIQTTYEYLASGGADQPLQNLRRLVIQVHSALTMLCHAHSLPSDVLQINGSLPESPIIPLFTSHARELAAHCQQNGFMLRPIVAPTVPKGTDRVRLCIHAGNTSTEVASLCKVIEQWACSKSGVVDDEAATQRLRYDVSKSGLSRL